MLEAPRNFAPQVQSVKPLVANRGSLLPSSGPHASPRNFLSKNSASLSPLQRNFIFQKMVINKEIHNWSTCRKQETRMLRSKWDIYITLPHPPPPSSEIIREEQIGKTLRARGSGCLWPNIHVLFHAWVWDPLPDMLGILYT